MQAATPRSTWTGFHPAHESAQTGKIALTEASTSPGSNDDGIRIGVYGLVMLIALLTAYVLGLIGDQSSSASGKNSLPHPTNPRSFSP
jgi:hypothetical protein